MLCRDIPWCVLRHGRQYAPKKLKNEMRVLARERKSLLIKFESPFKRSSESKLGAFRESQANTIINIEWFNRLA
ncbi:hypothetical protein EPI10_001234 [Gossypium australe]|uniref:Uncharacterized protein n=1 Tax=Gossypium australe TaxID=47621 RepID=A0A5B6VAF9_9ROSI|nr:hypothetical protein EPI10_001234 [Gossypium australe]